MSKAFLYGLALKNFRGIGQEGVRLAPFQGINFFIGPNNSGKSTILHFLANYLHATSRTPAQWGRVYESVDVRLGRSSDSVKFALGVPKSSVTDNIQRDIYERFQPKLDNLLDRISSQSVLWLAPSDNGRELEFDALDVQDVQSLLGKLEWRDIWNGLTGLSQGSLAEHWVPQTLKRLAAFAPMSLPNVRFIPAIRQISDAGSEFTDYSGRGLIDRLAELQNPPHNERGKRAKFDQINDFLRMVTDAPEASIEVPHDRRHLLVHMDDRILPLSSLGTGIHEVIMLASFCTLVENEILCVEEPEIHLHPLLQRKLIKYLDEHTSNQYFIATHSASLLDAVEAAIFSVENAGGESKISLAAKPGERYEICRKLGYHASDILQANCVIWVEGPSDRIYLNHWIQSSAPELIEGTDYSIMFYGGRLLSHLTANDPEVDEFISLRRLNRNLAILIDSDKDRPQSRVSATKTRVSTELSADVCWITAGREIENYVPENVIERALFQLYPQKFGGLADKSRYGRRLVFLDKRPGKSLVTDVDKVKVAQLVVAADPQAWEFDLRERIASLVAMIRKSGPRA